MQNKIFISAITITIAIASISSCKKEEVKDTEKPVISIIEPMMNDTFSMSVLDSVHIQFTATDNDELHDVTVNITDSTNTNVYSNSEDVDAKTYAFHQHFHPTSIKSLTPFTLSIDASDHHENNTNKTVIFYIRP